VRLLFVNRFYWPETPATGQLLADLAEGLAARGFEVEIVTSLPPTASARETHRGVSIRRVRGTWLAARAGALGKAADFASFLLGAIWQTWRRADRQTIVVALTDPPLLGVLLGIAARARGARMVHWVQDIYPEIAIVLANAGLLRALIPLRDHAWRDAELCITLGSDMAARLRDAGVAASRVVIVPNWSLANTHAAPPGDIASLRAAWALKDKFVVLYSGNLGRVHDLEPILDLAAALDDDPRFAIVFIGDGAQRSSLEATANEKRLRNVSFHPPQARARLATTLALADAHLVTLRADCAELVFPSKLYGAAAAARPVVFVGPDRCEVARIVKEAGLGLTATRDAMPVLAAELRVLAGDPARRERHAAAAAAFAARHNHEAAIARWIAALGGLQASSTPAARTVSVSS
jgi:glycosyltransferase involved in cell wall biosynthesis